jgi:DHA1 family inner membrane transport protein
LQPNDRIAAANDADLPRAQERLAILALAIAAFALNLNMLVLGAVLPFLPEELTPDDNSESTLLGAAAFCSALAALVAGPVADRVGRKRLLVIGMIAFAAASALQAFASDYSWMLFGRALSGAAVGAAYASASALAAVVVPYERRSAAMGAFTAGMFLALPIGLPLATWFGANGSWSSIFWAQLAIGLLGALLALRNVPERGRRSEWVAPTDVIRSGPVLAALAATMLHNGSFIPVVLLSGLWLDQEGIVPKAEQGQVWILLGLCSAVGSIAFGRVADRIGKRNFVLLSSALLIGCLLGITRATSMAMLAPLGLAVAAIASARTGPLQALTSGLVPSYQLATLMGLRSFAMQFGVFLFSLAAPSSGDGWYRTAIYAAVACQAASYALIRTFVKEGRA